MYRLIEVKVAATPSKNATCIFLRAMPIQGKLIQSPAGTAHRFDESVAAVEKVFVTKAIATVT
jgi:hypothetical protein